MASGWDSEGPGFETQWLQSTFDSGLPKKTQIIPIAKGAFNEKNMQGVLKKI